MHARHPGLQALDGTSEAREGNDGTPLRLADRMRQGVLAQGATHYAFEQHGFWDRSEDAAVLSLKEPHGLRSTEQIFEGPGARRVGHRIWVQGKSAKEFFGS